MYQIFISYRRGSGIYMAKNIATYLKSKGYEVFFDYESVKNGVFDQQIFTAIENSEDFILILTENALDDCANANDWVKTEILHAKKYNKNIILATDAERFKSYPSTLPDEIDFIKKIDWTPIHPKLFEGSMALLSKRLKSKKKKETIISSFLKILGIIGIIIFVFLMAYLYIPIPTKTMFIEDDEDYPIEVFAKYDCKEDELDFDNIFPEEIEVLFVCKSSYNNNIFLVNIEDLEMADIESYDITDDEFVDYFKNFTIHDYYKLVKSSIIMKDPSFEISAPTIYHSSDSEWIIFCATDNSQNVIWRMSRKITDMIYLNILITEGPKNIIEKKRYLINLKRLIKRVEGTLFKYIVEDL